MHSQGIPAGFSVKRYSSLWERNPFTLVRAAVSQAQPSAFEKLYLTSWLVDGGREVISVISDGKQQGTVKFRYDGQSPSEPTASTLAQVPAAADSQKSSTRFANLPNAQNSGLQENVSHNRAPGSRLYPGLPRVHWEGGLKPPSEEPRSWPKHNLPYSATAKSNSR